MLDAWEQLSSDIVGGEITADSNAMGQFIHNLRPELREVVSEELNSELNYDVPSTIKYKVYPTWHRWDVVMDENCALPERIQKKVVNQETGTAIIKRIKHNHVRIEWHPTSK